MTEMAKGSVTHQRLMLYYHKKVLTSASLPMKR